MAVTLVLALLLMVSSPGVWLLHVALKRGKCDAERHLAGGAGSKRKGLRAQAFGDRLRGSQTPEQANGLCR